MPTMIKNSGVAGRSGSSIRIKILLVLILLVLSLVSISIGAENFSLIGFLQGNDRDSFLAGISRIPRTLSIIITGAALSMSGLIMQTITNNRFVSPSTAGVMEWCRCGVALAILCAGGQSAMLKIVLAFLVSFVGTIIFMMLLQGLRIKNAYIVPLIGMMLGNVVSSITTFFAYQYDIIQNMSSWLQGNFALIIKGRYELLYLGIPCILLVYLYASKFTVAGMGEEMSVNLGLNHKRIVFLGMAIVAFTTSLVVVTVGSIPFIGLIIPNLVSFYYGDNLKGTLFETATVGAIFVMLCDLFGRVVIAPYELNISVVVSILGSIIFTVILFKKKR